MVRASFEDLMEMISVEDEVLLITRDLRVVEIRGPYELGAVEHIYGKTKDGRLAWVVNSDGTVEVKRR